MNEGGSFFDPGNAREAAEVWCLLKGGHWPKQLPEQRVVTPSGKAAFLHNGMMVLGAISAFQYLGLDRIGDELWERRGREQRDPATGRPLYPEEKQQEGEQEA